MRASVAAPGGLSLRTTSIRAAKPLLARLLHTQSMGALTGRDAFPSHGPGTHDWPYWRRDLRETLPDLVRVLAHA
jgi:S-formylglutathione hydrolase FrmB